MKYILLTAQLFLVYITNAQTKGFIGFEAGPNIANIRGLNVNDEKIKPMGGLLAGVIFGCHFSDKFAMKTGVFYEVKGAKMDLQLVDDNGLLIEEAECRNVFKYVTIPILLKYTVVNKVNFFVNAGPYFSFLIKNTVEANDVPDYGDVRENMSDYYKKRDIGVSFGMGISKDFGSGWNFQFEIRDNLGFTNITELEVDSHSVNHNTVNFLPGISYKFN